MIEQKTGAELIAAERQRQIESEGWTAEHDDGHTDGSLAIEACHFALMNTQLEWRGEGMCGSYDERAAKPRIRQLAIAGALIAAEIDRLQRAETLNPEPAR